MNAILRLWTRPDFRRNPARAVWRRASWRVRWQVNNTLWVQAFGPGLKIALPRRGTAVQIHYHGLSEPETAGFFQRFVRPGMAVWDVGAHIGEYALLAAHAAGPEGRVHAFEANPAMLQVLETNVLLNRFTTVTCCGSAVSDRVGEAEFMVQGSQPALSSLRLSGDRQEAAPHTTIRVPTTTLDNYADTHGVPHLIKIDVEGAELLVCRGGERLFNQAAEAAPVVVFEYSPGNYEARGFGANDALDCLRSHGYQFYRLDDAGSVAPFDPGGPLPATFNLVAAKGALTSRLSGPARAWVT